MNTKRKEKKHQGGRSNLTQIVKTLKQLLDKSYVEGVPKYKVTTRLRDMGTMQPPHTFMHAHVHARTRAHKLNPYIHNLNKKSNLNKFFDKTQVNSNMGGTIFQFESFSKCPTECNDILSFLFS